VKKQVTLKSSVFASLAALSLASGNLLGYIMLGGIVVGMAIALIVGFHDGSKRKQKKQQQLAQASAQKQEKKKPQQKPAKQVQVAEQPKEQKQVVQPVVATQTPVSENDEVLKGFEEETGLAIIARYKWSFMARLIQAPVEIKGFYSDLKNQLLSYNKVSSRVSTSYDSINLGRKGIAKFNVRGKTLYLYLALDPAQFDNTKYFVVASQSKKYSAVPCLYKIKSQRKFKWAKQLVDILAKQLGLVAGEAKNDDYKPAYMTIEQLIAQGYVKELISKEDYDEYLRKRALALVAAKHRASISASEAHNVLDDDSAAVLIQDLRKGSQVKTKKAVVNIDTLSQKFNAGDVVNVESLVEKGIVPKNTTFVKVLARGYIDKPLIVELQDYSLDAVKMIVLTDGQAHKV